MKVIVCGAGQVGLQIARHLSHEDNDVTVVDRNTDLVARAVNTLDVQGVVGYASYPDVLERAGAPDADMIIAATHSDEVNMVTCQVAHSVFSIRRRVARLRAQSYLDPGYADLFRKDHMPIDVIISPEREVAKAALLRLSAPAAFDTEMFMDNKAQLLGITIDENCPVVETPLWQLAELFPTLNGMVVGVRRNSRLLVPKGKDDQLLPGDSAYLFVQSGEVERMLASFGKETKRRDRIVILGAGAVGLDVARQIEANGKHVKVVEKDSARAEFAAETLERSIVLLGDGLDRALLDEAGIRNADAMLSITNDDKTNVLAAVRAKAEGCQLAVALINDPTLAELVNPLGIDAYIDPRAKTVSSILRHVRSGRVRSVYSIGNAEAEVIEAEVLANSAMARRQVRDIDFPEGALLAGVLRGDEFLRPESSLKLEPGDVVAIFVMASDVAEVERLIQATPEYF